MDRRESFFDALREEGLNRFRIHYDWRTGKTVFYAAREWDEDIEWRGYNRRFTIYSSLTEDAVYLGDKAAREMFRRHGLEGYAERVVDLMRKGRHILLEGFYWKKKDIRFVNSIHSVKLGIHNRSQAVVMGGIRRHDPDEPEIEVLADGMNLARGMSFKNVAAHVPCGGCKITVQSAPVDLEDLDEVGFLAYANDRTRNTTGPDMNYPAELADVVREHFSFGFAGGTKGSLGPTGRPTAWGTYNALKEALEIVDGNGSLEGRRIAVQGLGSVGAHLADFYLKDGARLVVTDVDRKAVDSFISAHPDAPVDAVAPDEIYSVDAEVFSPCAIGGVITEERIPGMHFRVIAGPANNQLKAASQEEECSLARVLQRAGILFLLDWWHNIGGVMTGYEEFVHQEDADMEALMSRIGRITREETRRLLRVAEEAGESPTETAYRLVEERIYGD
ncbi:MAG: Glu/Leu/Phe/Val dehydrogenase family protein [Desulfobacteraceae bacterium]